MTLHAHYRGASLILTAGATVPYYRLLRLELAARPARCNPVNTSGAKLSRWLLAILMLGAHSQQTAFAQSVPSVTQQPQSQNLLAGTDATFTVSATGQTPLSYQWSFNGSNLLNSPHISGATNATLIISNIAPADAGNYQAVVTNRHGSATSSNAMLTVLVPARITGQPSSQSVPLSSNATFTATATGTAPLSYQWYFNGTALTDGALVSGSTTTNLNISNVQTNDPGPYQLVVTNQYGSATSSIATLTVLIPPSVTMQPSNATVLFSSNIILAATATGTGPLSYQWYFSGAPMSDGGRFSGSRTGILNITNAQMGDVGSYQVVVTNAYGTATSAPASVVVVPLTGWGDDTYGELNFPTYLATVVAIATGSYQALYWNLGLRTDGTVGGWGARLGQTITDIPAGLDSVAAVSAGYRHGLALRSDGTVVAFGDNSFGETTVPPGLSNVVAIAAGGDYSLALQSDGTVIGWGYNFPFPSAPLPGFTNILAISAGTFDSLGLRYDGTVVGWGYDAYGETSSPAGLSNVIAVSAGAFHSLALKSDGTVAAWGYNYNGQATVPLGLSNVTAIAGGREHSVALRSDGTVVAWGDNSAGQATVPPGLSNVVAVTAGDFHSLALLQNPATQAPPSVWWPGLTNQIVPSGQTIALIPSVTGPLPISYQWYLDGSALSGQTNRWLVVAQSSGSGSYQLVARNSYGWTTSQVAAVHFQPFIVQQPTNQWLGFSSNVLFSASAIGEAPLSYQWYFNGSRLTDGGRISGS